MKAHSSTILRLAGALSLSLLAGAALASLQGGVWLAGWLAFSFLLLFSFVSLTLLHSWAVNLAPRTQPPAVSRTFGILLALAFALRLAAGTALYLALPVDGYDDPDDRAGYVFTDAHRRDEQAWELAGSDQPILAAFDRSFHTDQYGGLLAFCALVYRYLSPDAQRPLLLVLLSALVAALGLPFLWRSAHRLWGEKIALATCWIFALYPESILLGGAAMREPYLMTFSAMALWGFVCLTGGSAPDSQLQHSTLNSSPDTSRRSSVARRSSYAWLVLGFLGMLLVSPVVALVTLVIIAGWAYFAGERGRISGWMIAAAALVFILGLFLLSSSLNRQGEFDPSSPLAILGGFFREAVKWDVYQLERGSGWVQKLFDEMPAWLRLPFVTIYGVLQPVLPAAIVEPTTLTWKIVALMRALGWYMLLPALVLPIVTGPGAGRERRVVFWLAVACWFWILLTALRGGGDQWDNPRYRAILFAWQAIVAAHALAGPSHLGQTTGGRQPSTANRPLAIADWIQASRPRLQFTQVILCELVFLAIFTQWYASRYFHWGGQIPFGWMVALILGLWAAIIAGGRAWSRKHRTGDP